MYRLIAIVFSLVVLSGELAAAAAPTMAIAGQFGVNSAGTATYTIPITVPPGTAGFVPSLSLNYSSQGTDGIVGWQWSLGGLPSIGRCARTVAQDGVRGSVNYNTDDRFCLNGQRLILFSGTYGISGSEYRTEIESFSKVVAYGTTGAAPDYFVVQTKSGQIYELGNSTGSRLLAVGTSVVRSWAVNKISDTKGNYLTVTYTNDSTNGQIYPTQIDYTGNGAHAPYNSVRFTYSTSRADSVKMYQAGSSMQTTALLTDIVTYQGASTVVLDYHLEYRAGSTTTHSRLTSLTLCDNTTPCLTPSSCGTHCLAQSTFNWQGGVGLPAMTPTSISLAQGQQFSAGQYDGDGLTDVLISAGGNCGIWSGTSTLGSFSSSGIKGNYDVWEVEAGMYVHSYETNIQPCFSVGPYTGLRSVSDFNGDGFSDLDIVQAHSSSTQFNHLLFNDHSGNLTQPYPTPSPSQGLAPIVIADFNGDGYQDILAQTSTSSSYQIKLSNGNGNFSNSTSFSSALTLYAGDFDGDGCMDVLQQGSTSAIAYSCNPAVSSLSVTNWTGAKLVLGDFNGDGKTDILVTYPSAAGTLYLSTGTTLVAQSFSVPSGWGNYQIVVGDWNGDGMTDITLIANGGTTNEVLLSTGIGFVAGSTISNTNTSDNPETAVVADWNNDGALDLWLQRPASGDALYTFAYIPEMMSSVSNGIGATTSITYDRINKNGTLYTKGTSATYPSQDLDGAFYAVAQVDQSNGIGGNYTQSYSYSGAVGNLGAYVYVSGSSSQPSYVYSGALASNSGVGAIAFSAITMTDAQTGIVTTTNYETTFPKVGLIASQTRVKSSVTLSSVVNTWQSTVLTTGTTRNFVYLHTSTTTGHDLGGQAFPASTTDLTYDCDTVISGSSICAGTSPTGFGNTTVSSTCTYTSSCASGGSTVNQTNTFYNDSTNWLLGQITAKSVRSIVGSSDRTRSYSYAHESSSGLINQEIIEPSNPTYKLQADYTLDSFGNRTAVALSGSGIATQNTAVGYDTAGQFPTSTTNALSQTGSTAYDPAFGGAISHADINGVSSYTAYDSFGRPTLLTKSDGTKVAIAYAFCGGYHGGSVTCPTNATTFTTATPYASNGASQNGPIATTYFDALGRGIVTDAQGFDGTTIRAAATYDSHLDLHQASRPYFYPSGMAKYTTYLQDDLHRVTQATAPDSSVTYYTYAGLMSSVTDANGHTTTTVKNNQGLTASVVDALGTGSAHTTSYEYEAFGNVTKVTDPASNVISNTFDIRGRKTASTDPDMGSWSYSYDVLSLMYSQTDAKSQTTALTYDLLGRPTIRDESGFYSTWTYGTSSGFHNIGLLTEAKACTSPACTTVNSDRTFAYDTVGRPVTSTLKANGSTFTYTTVYDLTTGKIGSVTYPDAFVAKYLYNGYGYLCRIAGDSGTPSCASAAQSLWLANARDAEFHLTQQTYGNGLVTDQTYDANTGLPTQMRVGSSAAVASFDYGFDYVGNLMKRTDNNAPNAYTEHFCYDAINRLTTYDLTTSTSCPISGGTTVAYDAIGNILSKDGVGGYSYGSGAGPHAVTSIAGVLSGNYHYDANGNLDCQYTGGSMPSGCTGTGAVKKVVVTSFNMADTITQSTTTIGLAYDSEHQRVKQSATVAGTTTTTVYVNDPISGSMSEQVAVGSAPPSWNDYLTVDGQVFAQRTWSPSTGAPAWGSGITWGAASSHPFNWTAGSPSTTWVYFTLDQLGSVAVLTDAGGTVLQRLSYDAWGARRSSSGVSAACGTISSSTTTKGFTNQEMMDAICQVNLNARIYDPVIARFNTADPIVSNPWGAQGLNRYSYVINGPLSATDPSGYAPAGVKTEQVTVSYDKQRFEEMNRQAQMSIAFMGNATHFGYDYSPGRGGENERAYDGTIESVEVSDIYQAVVPKPVIVIDATGYGRPRTEGIASAFKWTGYAADGAAVFAMKVGSLGSGDKAILEGLEGYTRGITLPLAFAEGIGETAGEIKNGAPVGASILGNTLRAGLVIGAGGIGSTVGPVTGVVASGVADYYLPKGSTIGQGFINATSQIDIRYLQ